MRFSGGCVCGDVRYECDAENVLMFNCHCRDCKHVSGGPCAPVAYVKLSSFRVTKGRLSYYATESMAMGENKRGFCGRCGSRITGGETADGIGILAGSMDDSSWFTPQVDIQVEDAQPWDCMEPSRPRFERYPPQ